MSHTPLLGLSALLDLGVPREVLVRPVPTQEDSDGVLHSPEGCLRAEGGEHPAGTSVLLEHAPEKVCTCVLEDQTKDDLWYFCDVLRYILVAFQGIPDGTTALTWQKSYRQVERLEGNLRSVYEELLSRDSTFRIMSGAMEEYSQRTRAHQEKSLSRLQGQRGRRELLRRMGNPAVQPGQLVVAMHGKVQSPYHTDLFDAVLLSWGSVTPEGVFAVLPRELEGQFSTWSQQKNIPRPTPLTLAVAEEEDTSDVLEIARRLWADGSITEVGDALSVARRL